MGRQSTFQDEDIYRVVGDHLVRQGGITIPELVRAAGISSGSIYHRFGSREGLLAEAWLDAVQAFQQRFLRALGGGDLEAGCNAALVTPRFCREDHPRALVLMACRQSEFLGDGTPEHLRNEIAEANTAIFDAIRTFVQKTGLDPETARMALIGFPLGAVKMYLPSQRVPPRVDNMVRKGYHALLGSG